MTDTAIALQTETTSSIVRWVEQLEDLRQISAPETDAVVWQRELPLGVSRWLNQMQPGRLPSARMVLKPADIETCLADVFARLGHDPSEELNWLASDIRRMGQVVSALTKTSWLRLRLDPVSNNACARFHIDFVTARLICTYRGPGTEFGESDGAAPPSEIETVPTGMPILLKGKLWPQSRPVSLQHRSPPIAGTGTTRLLMVLEGVDASEIGQSPYDEIYDPKAG